MYKLVTGKKKKKKKDLTEDILNQDDALDI